MDNAEYKLITILKEKRKQKMSEDGGVLEVKVKKS